jgi:cephalosporin-C deacetylase
MNAIEKRIEELNSYLPPLNASPDLDLFWESTLKQYNNKPLHAVKNNIDSPLVYADVYKVTFEGYDDTPINGWYLLPKFAGNAKIPCIVSFHGYAVGRCYPEQYAQWLLMGMAVFAVDVRGQSSETGNNLENTFGMSKGWITQGILDRDKCYFRAITVDCLKAIDWVWEQPEIDRQKICVIGASQGGGLTLITAALSSKPSLAVANVPNMCHMDYGVLESTGSLTEVAQFVNKFPDKLNSVLKTLSYFDIMNLASRIRIPVMVSAGLKDTICMPETIFAAYNRITSEKLINVYPFMEHDNINYNNRQAMVFIGEHFSLNK